MIQTNKKGQSQSDNIVDDLLSFNEVSNWTVTGTGSATVTSSNFSNGSGSLFIENTNPTQDLTATNATQSTVIPKNGSYWLSMKFFKNIENSQLTGEVEIFKNDVLFNTQSFSYGMIIPDEDINNTWTRFVANQPFNFNASDVITFKFRLKSYSGFSGATTSFYVDGIKLEDNSANNSYPTGYTNPINTIEYIKESDAPNVPLNNALNWVADSSGTSNGVTYEKGDYLLTINSDGIIKTTILVNFSEL